MYLVHVLLYPPPRSGVPIYYKRNVFALLKVPCCRQVTFLLKITGVAEQSQLKTLLRKDSCQSYSKFYPNTTVLRSIGCLLNLHVNAQPSRKNSFILPV